MSKIEVDSIKKYLNACEIIGEEKMSHIMDNLKNQDYYTVIKIFIIQSTCKYFKMPLKRIKDSNHRGNWADCKSIIVYLLSIYLQCPRTEIKIELNYSHENIIDKKIRDINNLDAKIPYQNSLLKSIGELKIQIENFIETINN